MAEKFPASKVFPHLQGWCFPASAVKAAAGINGTTLNNILTKTNLILCSESAGQGRARQYCLVDAYQIALLRKLSLLTGQVAWASTALNHFLFEDVYADAPGPMAEGHKRKGMEARKKSLCEDIYQLPQAYKDRGDDPWFFYANARMLNLEYRFSSARLGDGNRVADALLGSGVFVNVTYLLEFVDCQLADALHLDLKAEDPDA